MEAVDKVSAEIEKVIIKFSAINEHSSKVIVSGIFNFANKNETLIKLINYSKMKLAHWKT